MADPERTALAQQEDEFPAVGEGNPFEDDTPLTCGVENPETCEACD